MVYPAVFKFVNWITGQPVAIDDALADALTKDVTSTLFEALPVLKAIIEDNKAVSTNGGTFTQGANRTRDLNTIVYNPNSIVSLNSNQFTLIPGTYLIKWQAPGHAVNRHQTLLYDITNTAEIKRGTSEFTTAASLIQTISFGSCVVDIDVSTVYEIQHICETTSATAGFGVAANFSTEVYTRVEIYQIAKG